MLSYILNLNLEKKILFIFLITIIFLSIKNFILKKRLEAMKLKQKVLKQQREKYQGETELDKITKEYFKLSTEHHKENDFENWIDNAEVGDTYHFSKDED